MLNSEKHADNSANATGKFPKICCSSANFCRIIQQFKILQNLLIFSVCRQTCYFHSKFLFLMANSNMKTIRSKTLCDIDKKNFLRVSIYTVILATLALKVYFVLHTFCIFFFSCSQSFEQTMYRKCNKSTESHQTLSDIY